MLFPITDHSAKQNKHTTFYLACGAKDAPLIIFVHGCRRRTRRPGQGTTLLVGSFDSHERESSNVCLHKAKS